MQIVALDVHISSITAAMLDLQAPEPKTVVRRFGTDPHGICELLERLSHDDVVLLEATTNAFWLYDQLEGRVKNCYILNTRKITLQGNKSDALDARRLVQLLSTHVLLGTENELPKVWVPPAEIRELRTLFSVYRSCKKVITQTKNRLHSLYRQQGFVFQRYRLSTSAKWRAVLNEYRLKGVLPLVAEELVKQLEAAESQAQSIRHLILRKGMEHYGQSVQLLMTIPGFSALTSIALLSDIGDIERFPTVKSFCCYLRTTPSLHASNRTVHLGAINKASRSLTVTLLTQSANHLKEATPYFRGFYERLRSGKGFGKTKIALIHKILVCAYYILKRQQPFRYETKVSYEWKTYRLMRELNRTPVACELGECLRD